MATDPVRLTRVGPEPASAYGGRYEEDSFDYPSPAPAQPAAAEEPPPGGEHRQVLSPEPGHGSEDRPDTGPTVLQRLVAARRTLLLTAAAGLIVAGGFGVGLSTVGDTMPPNPNPNPAPGGGGQVSVPGQPTAPPSVPGASGSEPTGGGTAPGAADASATPSQPGTPDGPGNGRGDHEREDGDSSEDG